MSSHETRELSMPLVAVDTAVLTLDSELGLCILLVHASQWERSNAAEWRLPGMFIQPGERLQEAALRALRVKAGVVGLTPRQLQVFDKPDRDDRGWTISVAHLEVMLRDQIELSPYTTLVAVTEHPDLDFDHREIIDLSVSRVRSEYGRSPDPYGLLRTSFFTMSDLHAVHEQVLGEPLNSDTFRRAMIPLLVPTDEWRRGVRGKPARLYRHPDEHEQLMGNE